ncbi:MAG: integrin alpha, partial [Candidatus Methylomirabilis sp.]|nr:integrin alpha [Deltaproteobacteria bacterium]
MRRLVTLFGVLIASAACPASAAGVLVALFEGEQPEDGFGGVIVTPGDLDGDGVDDLLLGAEDFVSAAPPSVGRIYAIRGGAWTPLYTLDGPETVQRFGSAIAGVGDVDGDLRPDFVAGLRGFAQPGGLSTGRVVLYSGATGQEIRVIDPPAEGVGWFGASVGGVGDANEDGVPDLVVGAPSGCSGGEFFYICAPGELYLLSGADGAVIRSWNGGQFDRLRLGVAAAGAGDVDADGRGDVIAGAITTYLSGWTVSQGYAYVLSSATGETLYERHSGFPLGFPAVLSYSPRVGSPGDLDGDGHDDFFTRIATGATVWSGATGEALAGSPTWSRAETGIPDTDGDGLPDLAFGRNNFDDTRNTEIFSGATSSWLGAIVGPEDSTFSYELGGLRAASGETLILTGQPSSEDDPIG